MKLLERYFINPSTTLPMTDSFCCHLDDRRGLFVRRDFSSHTRRNDSIDAAFCHFSIVSNENWIATQDDSQTERSRSLFLLAKRF